MQNLIVALIIALAVFYIGRRFYRSAKLDEGCGCGCSSCDTAQRACPPENIEHEQPPFQKIGRN